MGDGDHFTRGPVSQPMAATTELAKARGTRILSASRWASVRDHLPTIAGP